MHVVSTTTDQAKIQGKRGLHFSQIVHHAWQENRAPKKETTPYQARKAHVGTK